VISTWQRLAGGRRPGFAHSTYLSESATADRNWCLGFMMKEAGAFPEGADLKETLEFYFMLCSIEVDTEMMAIVAATLANGGAKHAAAAATAAATSSSHAHSTGVLAWCRCCGCPNPSVCGLS
jgi:glutaminase